jgi:hypothetical protein
VKHRDISLLRSVALPAEHGGWSLTLEPVLLGLIVEPGTAGLLLGFAALLAFLARSPLKLALVDRHRNRTLARTALARRVAAAELIAIGALALGATIAATAPFWWPLAGAAPLILVELWYGVRSRSRRLVAELAGSVGVAAIAAAIALAGGAADLLAGGLWLIAAARAVAAISFVRVQLRRGKNQPYSVWHSDGFQLAAVVAAAIGRSEDAVSWPGLIAIIGLAMVHAVLIRRPVPKTAIIGAQQVALGLTVVLAAALGALAPS